ncbi:phage DNA packaging protein [Selenomonas sp. FOBRC6]|uniref:head-tail connector protein n=1 Tax=Selenomonas sp. FOBRC6 TaxID=936572 RepID=UPI00027828F9|nr:head-tail connector protein [Selenomonas sp. FOBRC6]EJO22135.1 phage DNA packaging protein [Selenomonas sp. FOBRC6]
MLVPLEEVKQYLRIDGNDEDLLLSSFAETVEQLCTALLRVKDLSEVEDSAVVRIAILYAVSYLYEHREEADHRGLALTLRALLFGVRREVF